MNKAEQCKQLEIKIRHARLTGSFYHPTNPLDAWFCDSCCVFGKNGTKCWSCDSTDLCWQYIPRFGGGCQTTGPYETPAEPS